MVQPTAYKSRQRGNKMWQIVFPTLQGNSGVFFCFVLLFFFFMQTMGKGQCSVTIPRIGTSKILLRQVLLFLICTLWYVRSKKACLLQAVLCIHKYNLAANPPAVYSFYSYFCSFAILQLWHLKIQFKTVHRDNSSSTGCCGIFGCVSSCGHISCPTKASRLLGGLRVVLGESCERINQEEYILK